MGPETRDDELELVMVRHAESIWNAEDRWQGQSDVPLSDKGRDEARTLGGRLARLELDAIVASDLSRARETAEAVVAAQRGEGLPASLVAHAGLREMDLGAWCGMPHAEVISRFPEEVDALARGEDRPIGGHGESLPRFEARVHTALGEVLARARAQHDGARRVLVVTHGGCIRAVLMRLFALQGRRRPLEGAGNTSITTFRVRGDAIRALVSYNDATHLPSTRSHEGLASAPRDPNDRESLVGEAGRTRVMELLGVRDPSLLAAPPDDATTLVMPASRRLVRYAVRAR
ncbi:MAG: histidine phosphatase family protein [Sandaracinaceae bacterium]|nr:histidine phosphatase family protein [Sandaracinaceae bacterium]